MDRGLRLELFQKGQVRIVTMMVATMTTDVARGLWNQGEMGAHWVDLKDREGGKSMSQGCG